MATIKSFTSLEQSRKLAEILPLESADMRYTPFGDTHPWIWNEEVKLLEKGSVPCWSLAALLDVIPEPDLVQNSEGTWLIHSWVNAFPWSVGGYSYPVDACVDMIIKLNKLNLL